jgi:hypothetical protein
VTTKGKANFDSTSHEKNVYLHHLPEHKEWVSEVDCVFLILVGNSYNLLVPEWANAAISKKKRFHFVLNGNNLLCETLCRLKVRGA